jgi:hypothetical protein
MNLLHKLFEPKQYFESKDYDNDDDDDAKTPKAN